MRNPIAIVLSVLFAASLCIAVARADAKSDVLAAAQNFGAQKSVHASITGRKGETIDVDMIEPNKLHGTSPQGIEFVMIGSNSWIKMGGAWRAYPAAAGMFKTEMEYARGKEFQKSVLTDCTMSDAGMSNANGIAAHKYHVVCGSNHDASDVWIANGLPIKLTSADMTIVWSNYNSVADIKAPM
jgi:hypothetical protein